MPSLPQRLLFSFVVVLNVLLWSHSRYADRPQASLLQAHDISNPVQCRPLAFPVLDQCTHVAEHCPSPDTVLSVNYLQRYFCTNLPFRPLAFAALLLWLFFLFSTLGITASDFFTPNLATIAQLLGLDENVAGVTFLAFGNGSPDVFSTFSAMRANSGSLAIGELLGAASFIISCVVGSMCIIKPFKVAPGPFLRDVGFFTIAVSLLLVILRDGRIQAWEAGLLVALYVVYVIVVIVGSWWERRQEWKRHTEALVRAEYQEEELEPYRDNGELQDNLAASWPGINFPPSQGGPRSTSVPPSRLRLQTDLTQRPTRNPSPTPSIHYASQIPSFSLVGALEFRQVVASLQQRASSSSLSIFESPVTPFAGGRYHAYPTSRERTPRISLTGREEDPWDTALGLQRLHSPISTPPSEPHHNQQPIHLLPPAPAGSAPSDSQPTSPLTIPSILRTPASPTATDDSSSQTYILPPTRRQRALSALGHTAYILFPSLHHFRTQSFIGKLASVFATPAVLLLTLTLPVVVTPYISDSTAREKLVNMNADARLVDFEEEGVERVLIAEEEVLDDLHEMAFNKWLVSVQCALAPLFCVAVLAQGNAYQAALFIAAAVGGLAAAILVLVFADKGDHPTSKMARCSLGFFVAIVWIMAIADEVVNILQTFGFIFGLSDAIIGLTIFAMGNSLADLVANMSVAVFAPIMGFSACFGSPMLNILLGIGLSGSWMIHQTASPYELDFSDTLFVSTIGLLVLLAATLIFVPMNGYVLTRRWGIFLVASYSVLMVINILVELRSESLQ